MASFNALTQATINNYNHAQRAMLEGFERISKMWQLDEEGRIYTPYAAYSLKDVAAFESIRGHRWWRGLSEEALGRTSRARAMPRRCGCGSTWRPTRRRSTSRPTLAKTEAAALYQPKGSYAAAAHPRPVPHRAPGHIAPAGKTEAAALYQPKGNYAAAARSHDAYISAIGTSGDKLTYTKGYHHNESLRAVRFAVGGGLRGRRQGERRHLAVVAGIPHRPQGAILRRVYDNGGPDSYGCVLEIAGASRTLAASAVVRRLGERRPATTVTATTTAARGGK